MPLASSGDSGGTVAPPTTSAGGSTPAASPVAPGASPIPGSDYASAAALANNAYNSALATINGQRTAALQQYGYSGTIDPTTGMITNMQVDPNNPYGEFQQMLGSHATAQQQAQADAESRGLGNFGGARGGGLAAQGLTADQNQFGADSASLAQSLMGTLGDLQGQQETAGTTKDNTLWNAEQTSADNAIGNQQFDPANTSGVTDKAPAGSGDAFKSLPTQKAKAKAPAKAPVKVHAKAKPKVAPKNNATKKGKQ